MSAPGPRWLLPVLLGVAVLAGVVLVWPAWADPLFRAPATRFTDGHLLGVALWGEALRRGELPGVTTMLVGWPQGADLRPLLWPSTLLAALTGPPLAVTLTFALTPAFNLLGGWILGAALGRPPPGRAALGGLLALHPWVVETLSNGQVEQALLGGAALQVAAAVWAWEDPRRAPAAGAVTALVGWAAPHVALAGCVVLGLLSLPRIRRTPGPIVAVLAAVALGALAVDAWHAPAFGPGAHVFAPKGSDGRPTSVIDLPESASVASLLLPPAPTAAPVFHPNWLGAVALLGGLAGARRAPAALAVAGLMAVLALGPSLGPLPLPWAGLAAVAPSIARSMSAYRMVAGAVLALAIVASTVPSKVWQGLLLVGLALVEAPLAATRPLPLAAQFVPFDAGTAERRAGAGAVLDLPLAGPSCPNGTAHYLLQAARTGRPVPLLLTNARGGYAAVPGVVRTLGAGVQDDCAGLAGKVRGWGFTTVVLHVHDPDCPAPPPLRRCLEALGPGQSAPGVTWWDL